MLSGSGQKADGGGGGVGAVKAAASGISAPAVVAAAVGGLGLLKCITVVQAGEVGLVDTLGNVSEQHLQPGLHLVNPMAKVRKFSVKTQNLSFSAMVPTNEGLSVEVEMAVLFRLDPEHVRELYKNVGKKYQSVVLEPTARAVLRNTVARHEAKQLYTAGREKLALDVADELSTQLRSRGIVAEQVLMKRIKLPINVSAAIEHKLQMEQESERMKFVLIKEQQEAERKKIEAEGIANFQTIVSSGINDDLLRWKGIEATAELAKSPNAKTVVFGNPSDGLPVILGGLQPKGKSGGGMW